MADNRYSCDYAKRAANCKKCKTKLEKGCLRLAKVTASPFSDDGEMKLYHHPACLFQTFQRARASTKIIEEPGDIEGFQDLEPDDQEAIKALIRDSGKKDATASPAKAKKATPVKKPAAAKPKTSPAKRPASPPPTPPPSAPESPARAPLGDPKHKDNSFRQFRRICALLADESSYNAKTEILRKFFTKGSDGTAFHGDLVVWVRLLLPGVVKRVYNLQSKQLVKVFARIFRGHVEDDMLEDLEAGDVAETVAKFFEKSDHVSPQGKSELTLHYVDDCLRKLTSLTKEDDQQRALASMCQRCTANDLKMVVRLIKADLRIQTGAKHVLDGLHADAYAAFNSSRNIDKVLDRILELRSEGNPNGPLEVGASLLHPVQPMLAMACKSVDMAFAKCPNGMYAEIKYDGERVQLHKKGDDFRYYSRSLKPVLAHKVKPFKDVIPKAFPDGSDLILDAEVLMVDTNTGQPLPFGTLGKHKAAGFADAVPCLFVFDCIFYNGKSLMNTPIKARRKFLTDHMVEVDNSIKFSEVQLVTKKEQLGKMIKKVLKEGLEGLVLKDLKSTYEPGKRHWLKVKKDYLNEGAMADSADLVVLGAWYGTGNKGGIMSIFLMGCYDERSQKWCTVTKVHTGVDEATLDALQGQLKPNMRKIKQDPDRVPSWLSCSRQMTPDFVVADPKASPVWEITGAEFSQAGELHSAAGISIRFPRITKRRDDKTWQTATSLEELKALFKASKESNDFDIDYSKDGSDDDEEGPTPAKKIKEDPDATPTKKIKKEPEATPTKEVKEEKENSLPVTHRNLAKVKSEEDVETETEERHVGRSYNKTHIKTEYGFELNVIGGDLFASVDEGVSLAHCISRDYKLGKGIAKLFREKFGRVDELAKSGAEIGGVAVLKEKSGRFVYNLVTKAKYSDKPTYDSLKRSLEAMRKHALEHNVRDIAMPKIGCGLDGLQWNAVRTLVKNVFLRDKIKIEVYYLGGDDGSTTTTMTSRHPVKVEKKSPSSKDGYKQQPSIAAAFAKSPSKGEKRKSEDTNGSTSSKKQKRSEDDYADVAADLPDTFDGVRILMTKDVAVDAEEADKFERYVIAFGGDVVKEHEAGSATHVVYASTSAERKMDEAKKAKHVAKEWLIDSIKLKKMQKCELYSVYNREDVSAAVENLDAF